MRRRELIAASLAAGIAPISVACSGSDAGENDGQLLREFHIVREADGALRRLAVRRAARGQGLVVLVQSPELRVLGAADLPPG